jgi:hypothetical protein
MAYSNAFCIRELTPLLDSILDKRIMSFNRRAESIINPCFGNRYKIPVEKKQNLTGTITTIDGNATITGVGTLFTTEVFPGEMIHVNKSKEALRILSIQSDTLLTVDHEEVTNSVGIKSYPGRPLYAVSASTFFVIPDQIVTLSEYETARLLLMPTLADRARNREDQKRAFLDEYEMIAKPIMDKLREGLYYDSTLKSQIAANSTGRNVEVFENETVDNTVDFVEDMESFFKSYTGNGSGAINDTDIL